MAMPTLIYPAIGHSLWDQHDGIRPPSGWEIKNHLILKTDSSMGSHMLALLITLAPYRINKTAYCVGYTRDEMPIVICSYDFVLHVFTLEIDNGN